jgi:hypothetical protein
MTTPLFERGLPEEEARAEALQGGVPRLRVPQRRQIEMHCSTLTRLGLLHE